MMYGTPAGILVRVWSGAVRYFERLAGDAVTARGVDLLGLRGPPPI